MILWLCFPTLAVVAAVGSAIFATVAGQMLADFLNHVF
jgi:hypothetical protein